MSSSLQPPDLEPPSILPPRFAASRFNPSPKRKRGHPAISTIPPTPPTSSPPREASRPPQIPRDSSTHREMGLYRETSINTSFSSFTSNGGSEDETTNGPGSPRTKVAYNFQGLQLEDKEQVGRPDFSDMHRSEVMGAWDGAASDNDAIDMDDDIQDRQKDMARKRVKTLKMGHSGNRQRIIPETPDVRKGRELGQGGLKFEIIGQERYGDEMVLDCAKGVESSNEIDPVVFKGMGSPSGGRVKLLGTEVGALGKAYPSINRLADSKSRVSKKRAGTPPLQSSSSSTSKSKLLEPEDGERRVVDPVRAALTWHDDEITGHDPDDPDDDGEGINGIGFKPTSAEAYARTQKRRAQMAEYRNREAREARKVRSERRRGSEMAAKNRDEADMARKVRFVDAEIVSSGCL